MTAIAEAVLPAKGGRLGCTSSILILERKDFRNNVIILHKSPDTLGWVSG